MSDQQPRRLVGDRLHRQWAICEDIATRPGQTRADLARTFHLSERQIQADLNQIRADMGLPLIRQGGYRFADEGATSSGPRSLRLRDALVLVQLVVRGRRDRSAPREDVDALVAKLPDLFPPHLRPLAATCLVRRDAMLLTLAGALLDGASVRLDCPDWVDRWHGSTPVVRPELLIPHLGGFLLLGECKERPWTVFRLEQVRSVTANLGAETARMGR